MQEAASADALARRLIAEGIDCKGDLLRDFNATAKRPTATPPPARSGDGGNSPSAPASFGSGGAIGGGDSCNITIDGGLNCTVIGSSGDMFEARLTDSAAVEAVFKRIMGLLAAPATNYKGGGSMFPTAVSGGSTYSYGYGYGDDEDSGGYGYGEDGYEDEGMGMGPRAGSYTLAVPAEAERDAERCRAALHAVFSAGDAANGPSSSSSSYSVNLRAVGSGFWATITFPLPRIVTDTVAMAWGVRLGASIEVRLAFDSQAYPGGRPPKVRIVQVVAEGEGEGEGGNAADGTDGRFPLGQQLTRALSGYLARRWGDSDAFSPLPPPPAFTAREVYVSTVADGYLPAASGPTSPLSSSTTEVFSAGLRCLPMSAERRAAVLSARQTASIVATLHYLMGFTLAEAEEAALRHPTALSSAVRFLLNPSNTAPPPTAADATTASEEDKNSVEAILAKTSGPTVADDGCHGKFVPFDARGGGLLLHVVQYLMHRIPSASDYCVLCDAPHLFAMPMLRPAVCGRKLCLFAFTDLRVGQDAAETVATDAAVLDLLVILFKEAVTMAANYFDRDESCRERAARVLTPYPQVRDPKFPERLAMDPDNRDYAALRRVSRSLPTMEALVRGARSSDESKDPLASPLFGWIINSNRSYMVKLDPAAQITSMGTPHQFLLLMSTPERDGRFAELKRQFGSVWAFHGSPVYNWHSILRNGLANLSGTSHQLHGAVHGNGVYFATDPSASLSYSGGHRFGLSSSASSSPTLPVVVAPPAFLDGASVTCVALCEIISGSTRDHGWCWTVRDADRIMTRFLFVYTPTDRMPTAGQVSNNSPEFKSSVQKAANFYNLT